ncbi:MAG TPA: SGNH/GDSL hydrolase family protein [Mycobacteriales bacterium]|nr:SGNH/GDSL hydrolase family protein [Mycobacteriales bacterium]
MSLERGRVRQLATAAAVGGGSAGALGALLVGVLVGEARLARRWVGTPWGVPPAGDGIWGEGTGKPVRFAVLGDSSAAGLGVVHPIETPAVLVAAGLSEVAGQPVRLTNVAAVGAKSIHLAGQVERILPTRPEVALILVGTNDVKDRARPSEAVQHLAAAVTRLRAAGAQVVVGTCPDLGTIRPVAQPLRFLARIWSRQMAAAQTVAVIEAGGRTVSLGDVLGPEFAARPVEMFSADRFHPSAEGYAAAAAVVLPSVCAAIGVWPEDDELAEPRTERQARRRVRPVRRAAVRAVSRPGTEVAGTQVGGQDSGPRGRWARLRQRRPCLTAEPCEAEPREAGPPEAEPPDAEPPAAGVPDQVIGPRRTADGDGDRA